MKNVDLLVFKQLIENLPMFVWWKDKNSTLLGCNNELAHFLNLKSPAEIVGKTDFDLFDNKEDALFVRGIDQDVMSTGKPHLNFEECLDIPKLGKRWLSTSKIPMYNEDKVIVGTIGWFHDITDIKELQIKLDNSNQAIIDYSLKLEKSNKNFELANLDLERFTYVASHDLKTPVITMKAFAALLKREEQNNLSEKSLSYIDFICSSATRMEALIDGILEYSKVGAQNIVAENVTLDDIISGKIIDLNSNPETKNAKIELNLPSQEIKVYKNLIGMVFYNLIHNGIKFNEAPQPIVSCDFIEEEKHWIFSVTDNGSGIEPGHEIAIFEPFKRLVSGSIPGSGLGLSICKKIVSLHRGEIWTEKSMPGETIIKFSIAKDL